jgi:hypothetical protein
VSRRPWLIAVAIVVGLVVLYNVVAIVVFYFQGGN